MESVGSLQEYSRCSDQTLPLSQWLVGMIESPSPSGHVEKECCGRLSSIQVLAYVGVVFCGEGLKNLVIT